MDTSDGATTPGAPAHPGHQADDGCDCPAESTGCPRCARAAHQRAVAAFAALRDRLAAGEGLPPALAHSSRASRQWVSDELAQAARTLVASARAESVAWRATIWRRTVYGVSGAVALLLVGEVVTAFGAGWTAARTAGLVAAVVLGGLLGLAAWRHREHGGPVAPLVGEDNRFSTSRSVAAGWLLMAAFAVLVLAVELAVAPGERSEISGGLALAPADGLLTVTALTCVVTVLARLVVGARVRAQRLQKVRAVRPRAADLLTDDAGRGNFADVQYVLLNGAALVYAAVRLGRQPHEMPKLPWGLAVLVVLSAVTYLAAKYADGGRPTVLSVVRVRPEEGGFGDLDASIRTGDDIEIRGSGFVPAGTEDPEGLARTVVRLGPVHVHVPLVPVAGGFVNPTDTVVIVSVPAEVEPGRVDVQVVTAAGAETNRYPIHVLD